MGLTRKGREADFVSAFVVDVTRNLAIAAPFLIADHPFILTLSRPPAPGKAQCRKSERNGAQRCSNRSAARAPGKARLALRQPKGYGRPTGWAVSYPPR